MNISSALQLCLSGFLLATAASAQDITPEARHDAVKVAVTVCSTCHGPQGHSISPRFPNLAAQHAGYLIAQMKNFKAHTRGDPDALGYMWGMAAPLDDEMIDALADYYSRQTPVVGKSSNVDANSRGKAIYMNGIASEGIPACAVCHGPDAAGTEQFPRLAGQSAQYLLKQLRSFQNNLRDVAIMHGVASGLKVNEMEDVTAYLQSL